VVVSYMRAEEGREEAGDRDAGAEGEEDEEEDWIVGVVEWIKIARWKIEDECEAWCWITEM
jgi:hypothetical protein